MSDNPQILVQWQLLAAIVKNGQGAAVLRLARQMGIRGGTLLPARGTANIQALNWQDNPANDREVVFLIGDSDMIARTLSYLVIVLKLFNPKNGIAFTVSLQKLLGTRYRHRETMLASEGRDDTMQQAILTIIDPEMSQRVLEAASAAGATGATIIKARGIGGQETIQPMIAEVGTDKEIVMIVADIDDCAEITEAIRSVANLDEPGNGILFAIDIEEAQGLDDYLNGSLPVL